MGYWATEWIALPEALVLCAGVVDEARRRPRVTCEVDTARMRENLDLTRGQIMAEAVMMRLGPCDRARAGPRARPLGARAGPVGEGPPSRRRPARRARGRVAPDGRRARAADGSRLVPRALRALGRAVGRQAGGSSSMKITDVEPIVLRLPQVDTDAGGRDAGRVPRPRPHRRGHRRHRRGRHGRRYVARTIVEMPSSHSLARGLRRGARRRGPAPDRPALADDVPRERPLRAPRRRAPRHERDRHRPLGHRGQGRRPSRSPICSAGAASRRSASTRARSCRRRRTRSAGSPRPPSSPGTAP